MRRGIVVCLAIAGVLLAIWALRSRSLLGTSPNLVGRPAAADDAIHFTNIAAQAGVQFSYFRGETGKYWITETTGGGVALVDFDRDGWIDIVVTDGCQQPPDGTDRVHVSRIFRNQRDGTFVEVTGYCGVAHTGYGQGCYSFDYDDDGFDDLYFTCWGPNGLYHNHGDGTFGAAVTANAPAAEFWSTGAVPGDFDRDGYLDLLVVGYLDFDYRHIPLCGDPRTRVASYCGPDSFGATPSLMLRNRGDGTFEDAGASSAIVMANGTARPHAKGLGAVTADFNDDGWPDIFVANDMEPNFLFLNRTGDSGVMRFEEVGVSRGVATSVDGAAQDSMGVACGDVDGDGRIDLLVTNYYLEGVTFYRNLGASGFIDATRSVGLLSATRRVLGWGTGFFDFDNDGLLDLFTANGHVQPEPGAGVPYAMNAQVFRNIAGQRFEEVSGDAGEYFQAAWNGRGAAFGDIDNDGSIDIVVVHHHQPLAILRNDTRSNNHWLRLNLIGRRSDRAGIGARITITGASPIDPDARSGGDGAATATVVSRSIVRQSGSAGSYLSGNDVRVHTGLGPVTGVPEIEIRWPSGVVQKVSGVGCDREIVVREP